MICFVTIEERATTDMAYYFFVNEKVSPQSTGFSFREIPTQNELIEDDMFKTIWRTSICLIQGIKTILQ